MNMSAANSEEGEDPYGQGKDIGGGFSLSNMNQQKQRRETVQNTAIGSGLGGGSGF